MACMSLTQITAIVVLYAFDHWIAATVLLVLLITVRVTKDY